LITPSPNSFKQILLSTIPITPVTIQLGASTRESRTRIWACGRNKNIDRFDKKNNERTTTKNEMNESDDWTV